MNLKFTNSTCLIIIATTRGDKELAHNELSLACNRLIFQPSELNRARNRLVYLTTNLITSS